MSASWDPEELGVRVMSPRDLEAVQAVGQEAWSALASQDLGRKVRYPIRPGKVIEAYMWKEPGGCLVAEHRGEVVGAAFCHVWGRVGWFGPFEVLPHVQDRGVGRALLRGCEAYLHGKGCLVTGLETMSHIAKNIHFYLRAGYAVRGASLIMERELTAGMEEEAMAPSPRAEVGDALSAIRELSRRGHPLVDYSPEAHMAAEHGLGPVFLLPGQGGYRGLAVLSSYYPPQDADHAAMRLALVDPRSKGQKESFRRLLGACEAWAFGQGRRRLFLRFSAEHVRMYQELVARGYRLDAANLRMAKGPSFRERSRYHMAAWAG